MTTETEAYARAGDPGTSHEAAAAVRHTEQETRVYEVLLAHPRGLTTHGIAKAMGVERDRISARMAPLERKGRALRAGSCFEFEDDGRKSKRRIVWRAAPR